jgi:hypothetical protein
MACCVSALGSHRGSTLGRELQVIGDGQLPSGLPLLQGP